jgi:excisionase family DNA binding protein
MQFRDGQGPAKEPRRQLPPPQGAVQVQAEVRSDLAPVLGEILAQLRDIREQLSAKTKDYFTVEEVARATGRAAYTVRRWISEKRLHAIRLEDTGPRGRLLVPRDEFRRLIAAGLGSEVPNAFSV